MRFQLSPALLDALRERRGRLSTAAPDPVAVARGYASAMADWQREVEEQNDAFLLYAGMGPMLYVTADGRVLVDGRGWDDEALREATDDEAIGAMVVGARRTGITLLLDLLPPKPPSASDCAGCEGARFMTLQASNGEPFPIVCTDCAGRGWSAARA